MRKIKFRGIDVKTDKMVYGSLIQNNDASFIVDKVEHSYIGYCCDCDRPYSEQYQIKPNTVGEYTGLKDMNGIEIYEGDIVKLHNNWETKTSYFSQVEGDLSTGAMVKQHPAFEKMNLGCWRDLVSYCVSDGCTCEVIGNVYENPTLLEGNR